MMNGDDMPRGTPMHNSRKPYPPRYPDKGYSPSTSFNYGNSQGNNFNQAQGYAGGAQNAKRRFDRSKQPLNGLDKLAHQNDLIIRLLKEIRDRLPAPAVLPQIIQNNVDINDASGTEKNSDEFTESNESDAPAAESSLEEAACSVIPATTVEGKLSVEPLSQE